MHHKNFSALRFVQWGLLILAALVLLKFLYISNTISHASDDANGFIAKRNETVEAIRSENGPYLHKAISSSTTNSSITPDPHITSGRRPPKLSDRIDKTALDDEGSGPLNVIEAELSKSSGPLSDDVIAVIKINSVDLLTPIYKGTNSKTLDIGAGLIEGTSTFDNPTGNVGIAAHRDSYFRALKDIRVGDKINVATKDKNLIYLVKHLQVVEPSNTAVLYPDDTPKMTLVTCYPFDFVGKAPKRFIVSADLLTSTPI